MSTVQYNTTIEAPQEGIDAWTPTIYEVTNNVLENKDLTTLTLKPSGPGQLKEMMPGQFNMVYAFGIGEIPISVSSVLSSPGQIVHTIQNVGAVSGACYRLKTGDQLGLRGPFGTSWPIDQAKGKDVLIMAGGLGLAPLRPLIELIGANRDDFKQVNILYGTRSPENIIFHKDIISWQSDPDINFQITVDHAYSIWRGNIGIVTNLIEKARFDPQNTVAFICGPEIMMRYGVYGCIDHQIPEGSIYLSMERNMKCGIGHCGHCQYGPHFVCKDGAVFPYPSLKQLLKVTEL